ncbi:HD domain-containing protein [Butyricicoccus sp.]|uniref:HD domain-containing protein n=1 Tax=Butyricicoccus sp. TaxID=2049021 RepID=UPI002A85B82C|nr:HD domain-containing protein [Butyricicoccus sp.]
MDYRQIFIDQYKAHITRRGADRLLEWLMGSDFFTAPASTRFHAAYEGGLVEHSLNVYKVFMKKHFVEGEDDPESVAIATLLHDICKAGFYEVSYRNRKNEAGTWEKVPYYTINDRFPYGHGEKSVFLIERFMRLKNEEAFAIRWHMGGFDDSAKAGSFAIAHAFEQYPLAVKVHLSDLEATYLCENRNEEGE